MTAPTNLQNRSPNPCQTGAVLPQGAAGRLRRLLFSLADTPPQSDDLKDPDAFFNFAASCQVRSLGESTEGLAGVGGESEGYLFSAFGSRSVKQILPKLES